MRRWLSFLVGILGISLMISPLTLLAEDIPSYVLIEEASLWQYTVTDTDGFYEMDPLWNQQDFNDVWSERSAPFGDRLDAANAEASGWIGEMHGLFLRHSFEISSPESLQGLHFYLNIFYDNTVHIYLNGEEVFADDALGGEGDWNDSYERFDLGDLSALLKEGDNLLAVSLLDGWGGREFDLSLIASGEGLSTIPLPGPYDPPQETDTPATENTPESSITQTDSQTGSMLPFTQAPPRTSAPAVTIPIAEETVSDGWWNYPRAAALVCISGAAALIMIGLSVLVAVHLRKRS